MITPTAGQQIIRAKHDASHAAARLEQARVRPGMREYEAHELLRSAERLLQEAQDEKVALEGVSTL